jgi:signal transduction histidine kinase
MEIEQVMLNLIKNSCQAMVGRPEGSPKAQIILRTLLKGNTVHMEVEDNGVGMNEEVRRQIFDPFFTTKDVGEGTGLGLSVCYSIIVDKHKGHIWVESEPGKGTKFVIELPVENK